MATRKWNPDNMFGSVTESLPSTVPRCEWNMCTWVHHWHASIQGSLQSRCVHALILAETIQSLTWVSFHTQFGINDPVAIVQLVNSFRSYFAGDCWYWSRRCGQEAYGLWLSCSNHVLACEWHTHDRAHWKWEQGIYFVYLRICWLLFVYSRQL